MEFTDPLESLIEKKIKKEVPPIKGPLEDLPILKGTKKGRRLSDEDWKKLNAPKPFNKRQNDLNEVDEFIIHLEALYEKYKANPNIERNLGRFIDHYKDNRVKSTIPML